jgi:hypothetical protein
MSQNRPKHTPKPWQLENSYIIAWRDGRKLYLGGVLRGEGTGLLSSEEYHANRALMVKAPAMYDALRNLIEAAEALADQEEATLATSELHGDQKKVTPANMFLSVGRSDIRDAIAEARKLLEE